MSLENPAVGYIICFNISALFLTISSSEISSWLCRFLIIRNLSSIEDVGDWLIAWKMVGV